MPRDNDVETSVERVDPLVGTTFDQRFRVEERIATGGFGAIYRATHIKSGHQIALKVLLPALAQDLGIVARFRREGDALTTLRSPHTINAYELGQAGDRTLFITMELLYGESLFERYKSNGPFEWKRMVKIARQVCESLAEAHALGIVHRDLKPTNIHLEKHGDDIDYVKVLDFGIAKILGAGAADLTNAGHMIGTLDYMSPEQMVGGKVTGQTDIYTLGIVMYEMIAGCTPFPEALSAAQALAAVMKTKPDALYLRAPVPEELDRIVMRCLERETHKRYATVDELRADLDQLVANPDRSRSILTKPVERFDEATQFTPPPMMFDEGRRSPDFEETQFTPPPERLIAESRSEWGAEPTTAAAPSAVLLAQARRAKRPSGEQTQLTPPPERILDDLRAAPAPEWSDDDEHVPTTNRRPDGMPRRSPADSSGEHDNVTKVARVSDIAGALARSSKEPESLTTAIPRNRASTEDNERVTKVARLADLAATARAGGPRDMSERAATVPREPKDRGPSGASERAMTVPRDASERAMTTPRDPKAGRDLGDFRDAHEVPTMSRDDYERAATLHVPVVARPAGGLGSSGLSDELAGRGSSAELGDRDMTMPRRMPPSRNDDSSVEAATPPFARVEADVATPPAARRADSSPPASRRADSSPRKGDVVPPPIPPAMRKPPSSPPANSPRPGSRTAPPPSTLTPPRTLTPQQPPSAPRTFTPQQPPSVQISTPIPQLAVAPFSQQPKLPTPLPSTVPPHSVGPPHLATPQPFSQPFMPQQPGHAAQGDMHYMPGVPMQPTPYGSPPPGMQPYPPPGMQPYGQQPYQSRSFDMARIAAREALIRKVIWIVALVLAGGVGIILATQL